jgi:hypothetical protein
MAVLPIFNDHPYSSIFGIMLFPTDPKKAETWAAYYLSSAIVQAKRVAGVQVSPDRFYEILLTSAEFDRELVNEANQSQIEGEAAGKVIQWLYIEIQKDRTKASMKTARMDFIDAADKAGGRTIKDKTLEGYLSRKARVLHFWGALALRDYRLFPGTGLIDDDDLQHFFSEAEQLLDSLNDWNNERNVSWKTHLDKNPYRMPTGWTPPPVRYDQPQRGGLPSYHKVV